MGYQYCQIAGLALEEVLVNLCTKSGMGPHAPRLPGLAYVAIARVRPFAGSARRGLPSLTKFLQHREHSRHKSRVEYEVQMGELREKFTRPRGISPN